MGEKLNLRHFCKICFKFLSILATFSLKVCKKYGIKFSIFYQKFFFLTENFLQISKWEESGKKY
jgi:hypothetical protein